MGEMRGPGWGVRQRCRAAGGEGGGLRTRHQHHVFACAHAAKSTEVSLTTELQHKSIYAIIYNKLECSVGIHNGSPCYNQSKQHASIVYCHRSMQASCVLPQKHANIVCIAKEACNTCRQLSHLSCISIEACEHTCCFGLRGCLLPGEDGSSSSPPFANSAMSSTCSLALSAAACIRACRLYAAGT